MASLSNLVPEVLNAITLELDGRQIILLRLTGDIGLNRRLANGGVTRFTYERSSSRPHHFCFAPFEQLSTLTLTSSKRNTISEDRITFSPGSFGPRLREISWYFTHSFMLFNELVESGEHDFSGIESLALSGSEFYHKQINAELGQRMPRLRKLGLSALPAFYPSQLPRSLTKCFIECERIIWEDAKEYSGFPSGLESLEIVAYSQHNFVTPLPPTLTAFSISAAILTQPLQAREIGLLPRSLTSLEAPLDDVEDIAEALRALPPSITHLNFEDAPTIGSEHFKLLPRSLTKTNLTIREEELNAKNVVFLPPSLTTLCYDDEVDGSLAGLLPRSLTQLSIASPLKGLLPPGLKTLKLSSLDDSVTELPTLFSLSIGSVETESLLWHLPTTLTTLEIEAAKPLNSGFLPALPRSLRSFEFISEQYGSKQYIQSEDLVGLPPSLTNIILHAVHFKRTPDWSSLPSLLKFISLHAEIDSDCRIVKPEEPTFKHLKHLEMLALHISTDLSGLGNLIIDNLPPRVNSLTYLNGHHGPTDTILASSLENLPSTLTHLVLPKTFYSPTEIAKMDHIPTRVTLGNALSQNLSKEWHAHKSLMTDRASFRAPLALHAAQIAMEAGNRHHHTPGGPQQESALAQLYHPPSSLF